MAARSSESSASEPAPVVVLDPEVYQDMRWCAKCAGEQIFVEVYEFESGRVGVCLGCGDESVVRFSRVNSEVA